jgi:hypothetical protein
MNVLKLSRLPQNSSEGTKLPVDILLAISGLVGRQMGIFAKLFILIFFYVGSSHLTWIFYYLFVFYLTTLPVAQTI